MTSESILLIGRETRTAGDVLGTHADRLLRRGVADDVAVATYGAEPVRDLREKVARLAADTVYAVPMCVAHTRDTIDEVPAALSYAPGNVRYCEPLGRSPAVTELIAERGTDLLPPAEDVTLILVGFGSSSKPYHRQAADYHAARLREQSGYGEVLTCYLIQNPAVECARYNATTARSVAVPLFVTRTEATERRIPEELDLARGGIEYADPFGTHPLVTDAVHAEVAKRRALAADDATPDAFGTHLTRTRRPVATDGDGTGR